MADRKKKWKGQCSTGQSPQWAVVVIKEEEENKKKEEAHKHSRGKRLLL